MSALSDTEKSELLRAVTITLQETRKVRDYTSIAHKTAVDAHEKAQAAYDYVCRMMQS